MKLNREGIKQLLAEHPYLREKLFARGFVFTNHCIDAGEYPFYGLWHAQGIGPYQLLVSPGQQHYQASEGGTTILLVGHAYNPFTLEHREGAILASLLDAYSPGAMVNPSSTFWTHINELTGVFTLLVVDEDGARDAAGTAAQGAPTVYVIGDASGMQTTFFTTGGSPVMVSSHTNLIGDLLDLDWNPYVEELAHYRFFPLLGNSLPGDITQFSEVKRLIPNHFVCIEGGKVQERRFFTPQTLPLRHDELVYSVAQTMRANLVLIARKWGKPAISLTGGCDSKTTLASAVDQYDRFRYFSYVSSEEERVDAEAARCICDALGLDHRYYEIPADNGALADTDLVAELLNWNTGNIRRSNANDVRKRAFFAGIEDFDVEVKSWASEIGRAYYSKRFNGRVDFGDCPTPRVCTTLYKFFLHDRELVRRTDEIFKDYLDAYFERASDAPVPWQEQFFWEFRVPSWNGLVITGEHRYSFDITIPYNNRCLLELLLSAPIEYRIADTIYKDVRELLNPTIDGTGVAVTNVKHSGRRAMAEDAYYAINSCLPF